MTTGQLSGLIVAILLPILVGAVPYYIFWRRSSKVESGMMGAIAYGVLGYFWQEILYSFLALLALANMTSILNATGKSAVVVAIVESVFSALFVGLGLYWGVYLTNSKQRSIYRSMTIGIGFGIGSALLTYGFELYYAVRINMGIYTGSDSTKEQLMSTSTASLYVAAYRNVMTMLVFMGVALLIGRFHMEKKRLYAYLVPVIIWVFLRFTDVILNSYTSQVVSKTIYCIVITLLAAGSVYVIANYLRDDTARKEG